MLVSVGSLAVRALTARYDRSLTRRPLLDPRARRPAPAAGRADPASGPLNFLLVGWDGSHPTIGPHAATIMVLHVSADLGRAYLVALPGDLLVELDDPADRSHPRGSAQRQLADLDRTDGATSTQVLSAALARLLGVRFDGAALVDVAALPPVIDRLGGISVADVAGGPGDEPAGYAALDGGGAVELLRENGTERPGADRHRTHQRVWRATARRIAEIDLLGNPLQLDQVARTVAAAAVVDTNGVGLARLAEVLGKLRAEEVAGVHLPGRPPAGESPTPWAHPHARDLSESLRRDDLAAWTEQNPHWADDH